MLLDEAGEIGRERRPDARLGKLAQIVDRAVDRDLERLAGMGVEHRHRPPAAEIGGDGLERALGGGEADSHRRPVAGRGDERFEPLEAEGEMDAALVAGERMDLVDDEVTNLAQAVARPRGEEQVERLGRGAKDMRRALGELGALARRGVAGAQPDPQLGRGQAEPRRRLPHPRQRQLEVAVEIVRQRLERRDVEDLNPVEARARVSSAATRSRQKRNAARVFPDPVGASRSVCSPRAIAGQPSACGGDGAAKVASNQARVGAENEASGESTGTELRLTAAPWRRHAARHDRPADGGATR